MKLLPRTLFGRLFGLLLVVVLTGQLATWLVLEWHRLHVLSEQVTEQALDLLAEAEEYLYRVDRNDTRNWFELNGRPYQLQLLPRTIASPAEQTPSLLARVILRDLNDALAQRNRAIYTSWPTEQLWVSVELYNGEYWLVIPLGRFHGPPLAPLWVGSFIFLILAAAASALFAWRLNRPLRKLAEASAALSKGKHVEAVSEEGPAEIHVLAQAFNRMQHDLRLHEKEREIWLAGVSHDLRTPLTRLELALALLPEDPEHGAMQHDLEDMKRTLQQFVDYARGSKGETIADVDVRGWLQRLFKPVDSQHLILTLSDELPERLRLKPTSTSRILTNLLENASRYGKPPVELSLSLHGQMLELIVRDHGVGIPRSEQEDLLHPFRRGSSARTADGGCGLGLAIVDRLVHELGGNWSLANHQQGGLEVRVELPVA